MTTVFKESKAQRQCGFWREKSALLYASVFWGIMWSAAICAGLHGDLVLFAVLQRLKHLDFFCHSVLSIFPIWILWKITCFSDLPIICLFIYFSKYKILTLNFRKHQSLACIKAIMIKEFIEEFWRLELSTDTCTVYACNKRLVFRQRTMYAEQSCSIGVLESKEGRRNKEK